MTKVEVRQLHNDLFAEYTKSARRKKYVGSRADIKAKEGFAWLSTAVGRWCFIPLREQFSIDAIVVVRADNLINA